MSGAPAGYDAFLSYSRADQDAAGALRDRLVGVGKLRIFVGWRALLAGLLPWQPAVDFALAGCRAMVLLIRPKNIDGSRHRELQLDFNSRLQEVLQNFFEKHFLR